MRVPLIWDMRAIWTYADDLIAAVGAHDRPVLLLPADTRWAGAL